MDEQKFRVEVLEDAKQFLDGIDEKSREKIITTFGKPKEQMIKNFLKSYKTKFGSSELNTTKLTSDFFAFWNKTDKEDTIVISTHGIIKKTDKIPKKEIEKAERIRQQYFNEKNKRK